VQGKLNKKKQLGFWLVEKGVEGGVNKKKCVKLRKVGGKKSSLKEPLGRDGTERSKLLGKCAVTSMLSVI